MPTHDVMVLEGGELVTEADGDRAFALHEDIKRVRVAVEVAGVEMGRLLHEMERGKGYKHLEHPTFESYLGDPDVKMQRRWAFVLMAVYRTFVLGEKVQHAALCPIPSEDLALAGMGNLAVIIPPFRQATREEDAHEWLSRAQELSRSDLEALVREWSRGQIGPAPPLPDGTFDLVYADPPWRYEFVEAENRAIENHYPTMSLDEIKALELPALASDALLLLWATPPKLDEALQVMREWGFSYRSCLVWVKHAIGMGYWARQRHELLLVGRVGEFSPPEPAARPDSVIESPREEHSKKPEQVYALIEGMFPDARKIELFSRRPREGWAMWGNQV